MEFLSMLAESQEHAIITESFLKWVCLFMGGAIAALFAYIKKIVDERKDDLKAQLANAAKAQNDIEEPIRERYQKVIADKDQEIEGLKAEIREMTFEKFTFLQAQIDEAKRQEKGLVDLTQDYNEIVDQHLTPLIEQVVAELEHYRKRRQRGNRNESRHEHRNDSRNG